MISTKLEAHQKAIEWQEWQSKQSLSLFELAQWNRYFTGIARKFHLVKEFRENDII